MSTLIRWVLGAKDGGMYQSDHPKGLSIGETWMPPGILHSPEGKECCGCDCCEEKFCGKTTNAVQAANAKIAGAVALIAVLEVALGQIERIEVVATRTKPVILVAVRSIQRETYFHVGRTFSVNVMVNVAARIVPRWQLWLV